MEIIIDNTITLGEDSVYKLKAPIQGLASSDIRTGSGLYAGRGLGFVSGQFLGYRTIVLNGFYIGSTCNDALSLREGLFGTLQIQKEYTLAFHGFDTNAWLITGFLTNMKGDITNLRAGEFQLTFLCPDPVFYKGNSATSTTISTTWASQSITNLNVSTPKTANIPNDGNAETFIRTNWSAGQIQDFVVTNMDKGQSLSVATMPSGTTDIWFQTHKILLNGQIYNRYLNMDSQWFSISPGGDTIQFETSSSSNKSFYVYYRRGGRLGL